MAASRLATMKNYIAIILTLLVSTATAQQQKLPGNLYYLGDDLETTSVADKQTALVVVKEPYGLRDQREDNLLSMSRQLAAMSSGALAGGRATQRRKT